MGREARSRERGPSFAFSVAHLNPGWLPGGGGGGGGEYMGAALERAVAPDLDFTRDLIIRAARPSGQECPRDCGEPEPEGDPHTVSPPHPPACLPRATAGPPGGPGPWRPAIPGPRGPPSAAGGRLRFVFWLLSARSVTSSAQRGDTAPASGEAEGKDGRGRGQDSGGTRRHPQMEGGNRDSEAGGTLITPTPLRHG